MAKRHTLISLGMLVLVLAGAGQDQPGPQGGQGSPEPIQAQGIDNLYRLSPRLYSGSQPEGEAGFETLKRLGIGTIISVDGSRPEVEAARRLGLRYIHLPFGYDGIPRDQAVKLVKAVEDATGPVFVHCHHGKHRGPAAAAVCGLATEGWDKEQARAWLEEAGTDPSYRGLFASVAGFEPPSAEELGRVGPADLPERAEVPDLVETMVAIDHLWDHLKAIQAAGFRVPPAQPDLDPPHEALMLVEQFREARRLPESSARGPEFEQLLSSAEQSACDLEAALRRDAANPSLSVPAETEAAFVRAGKSCTHCHQRFRDDQRHP